MLCNWLYSKIHVIMASPLAYLLLYFITKLIYLQYYACIFYISSLYLQYVPMYVMCYVGYDKFPGLVLWGMKEIVSNYQSEKLLILTYLQCLYSKMCNLAMLSYTYNVIYSMYILDTLHLYTESITIALEGLLCTNVLELRRNCYFREKYPVVFANLRQEH